MKPIPMTHECGAHEHDGCNHVITAATSGNKIIRTYCKCPYHEALLLKIQNAFMKESIAALKELLKELKQ